VVDPDPADQAGTGEPDEIDFHNRPIVTLETAFGFGGTVATCFIAEPLSLQPNRWGWTNGPLQPNTTLTLQLFAAAGQCNLAKGTHVGNVTVEYGSQSVTVTYTMFAGYTLEETHLYIGNVPIPLNRDRTTVAPGKYPYKHDLTGATSDSYTVEITGPIYVIAHAEVAIPN
jgi:hypothetical protein